MFEKIEHLVEKGLFSSRWLIAPLYVGLMGALIILLIKFVQKFYFITDTFLTMKSTDVMLGILGLVDIVLIANLLLIIIFSGYENFVSKIDFVQGHVDKPDWMGKVDYAALKIKVIGSIVAISSIELLKLFINVQNGKLQSGEITSETVYALVVIHMVFVFSGVFFAVMERIMHPAHLEHHSGNSDTQNGH
ncbi:TIGR00645 family protein [Candidatus Albibeggiatoa sp. nov. NOAA]|uniref:TIGR00645 family protein n=1 Tax=Candidatus Albibeggiatoa sp. nov. NOAA TaxID=3162724 RepID=UPI0033050402|nr:TIGR00645 family protein [Thiotrichaceae bacterium]